MNNAHDDRPTAREAPPEAPQPFQFGLRSLLVLMLACAVLLKLMDKFVVPAPVGFSFRIVMAFYFMALTAYAVLRVPHIWRTVGPGSPRWRRVRQQRKEFEALAARRRGGQS